MVKHRSKHLDVDYRRHPDIQVDRWMSPIGDVVAKGLKRLIEE